MMWPMIVARIVRAEQRSTSAPLEGPMTSHGFGDADTPL